MAKGKTPLDVLVEKRSDRSNYLLERCKQASVGFSSHGNVIITDKQSVSGDEILYIARYNQKHK